MKSLKVMSVVALSAISLTVFTGCPSANSGVVFGRSETLRAQHVSYGTVVEVRAGKIEGTKSAVGSIGGAAMGGVLGNLVGGGRGNNIATVGGAIGGALLGAAAEEAITSKNGLQITVQLDNGQTVMVVQEADVQFVAGQRVRVLSGGGGRDRVQPL